jgi:hypothetical protein
MAHIVVIGRSLQEIYKTKNYVGKEVDDYFCSTLWSEYLDSIIKPEATRFDKLLAAVNPRQRLHKKVTLGDLFLILIHQSMETNSIMVIVCKLLFDHRSQEQTKT